LKDHQAKRQILNRLDRLSNGHFGKIRSAGGMASEIKIENQPAYGIDFTIKGQKIILL
jgi:putative addiction module killer protein